MTLISLLILGLVLSLDNARLAVALGAFKLSWRRALRIAVVFGLYLVVRSLQTEAPEELDERWVLFGIPLSLSLDNLLAGTGLGMLGFPPVFTAVVFGTMTALTTFLGLQLGGVVARFIPIRADLLSGLGLSIMAAGAAPGGGVRIP